MMLMLGCPASCASQRAGVVLEPGAGKCRQLVRQRALATQLPTQATELPTQTAPLNACCRLAAVGAEPGMCIPAAETAPCQRALASTHLQQQADVKLHHQGGSIALQHLCLQCAREGFIRWLVARQTLQCQLVATQQASISVCSQQTPLGASCWPVKRCHKFCPAACQAVPCPSIRHPPATAAAARPHCPARSR